MNHSIPRGHKSVFDLQKFILQIFDIITVKAAPGCLVWSQRALACYHFNIFHLLKDLISDNSLIIILFFGAFLLINSLKAANSLSTVQRKYIYTGI